MPWWLYVVGIIGLLVVLEHLCKRYFSAAQEPWNARGKVVVITGASSGIGESLALKFAKEGSRLALCARRVEKLDSVKAASLSAGAADVITVQCDVSKEEDCKNFISKTAEHFGRIDCLILNAGVSQNLLAENAKDSSLYHQLMQTNYFGSVYCTLAALPHIKRNWGAKIAIISSGIAKISCPSRTGYAGSKWALHGFFDALRMELCRKYGTTITIICPPTVATEINNHRLGDQSFQTPDMSSDECAAISYNAIINHQREELFLPLLKYASPLKPIFPWLMDFVTVQKLKRLKIFDENAVRVPVDDTPASSKLE